MSGQALKHTIETLRLHFGDRFSTADAVREHHGHDMSRQPTRMPDAVVYVESEDEVARVVSACFAAGIPVTPFAAGSSMEGHTIPLKGGISLDLTRMNRILAVNNADMDAQVQAGVTRKQLNAHIRDTGLFFPIDPGADASLGGMASTRASGTTAVRYGTMRENVLALRVVTPEGKIITTGRRTRKSSTGYDLTKLFVGAEGTLGVITEVTIKLHPIPETIASAVCSFETMRGAVEAVVATIQSGIPVARIEFLDEVAVEAANRHAGLSLTVAPTLFLEFHGSRAGWRSSQRPCGRSPMNSAAPTSPGRPARKSANACGKRATRRSTRTRRCGPAARRLRPMSACRSPGWPTRSWLPVPISTARS